MKVLKYAIRFKRKILWIIALHGFFMIALLYLLHKDLFQNNKNVLDFSNNIILIKKYTGKRNPLLAWQSNSMKKSLNIIQKMEKSDFIIYDDSVDENFHSQFYLNNSDVVVFVHIQKTGGSTFNRHLVYDLSIGKCPKRKSSRGRFRVCLRPNEDSEWLFSRFSTRLQSPCGLHADFTTLRSCVPQYFKTFYHISKRHRYFYVTILREPIARYLSEWGHTQRGATWNLSLLQCKSEYFSHSTCWNGTDWKGVSLDEFLQCPYNWANNRMTWMLADLNRIDCTGDSLRSEEINRILLESAKENLKNLSFFGITEKQKETQFMFEVVFNLPFKKEFTLTSSTLSSSHKVTKYQMRLIKKRNDLDIQLYRFALNIFNQRFREMKGKVL